jgi:hypothetical protein
MHGISVNYCKLETKDLREVVVTKETMLLYRILHTTKTKFKILITIILGSTKDLRMETIQMTRKIRIFKIV